MGSRSVITAINMHHSRPVRYTVETDLARGPFRETPASLLPAPPGARLGGKVVGKPGLMLFPWGRGGEEGDPTGSQAQLFWGRWGCRHKVATVTGASKVGVHSL